ncbi:MAG: PLP-dependent aminotransferase family protein [Proteobacteria bacterium]|nr:MAG: PLP-dependent aminotransferase family protein [Pseudomonadota bacterium]
MPKLRSKFSARVLDLEPSPIRDILAVIDRPGLISFAGGLPSTDSFPDLDLLGMPPAQLQYGPTEGDPDLRAWIAADLCRVGLVCTAEQVLIVSGSQQGIDLVAKLFIDPGTPIAVESPTYLAALQVFRFFGARLRSFAPTATRDLTTLLQGHAFAYAIPNFQNPTGHCFSSAERAVLAAACDATQTPLFEDDPYRDLVYDPCDTRPVCAAIRRAPWIYQGSFSKSLAPGLRLGYLACSAELMPYLVRLKQAADLHSNRISQWLVLQRLNDRSYRAHIESLVVHYRRKRNLFERALRRTFADLASWVSPPGGLFFWLQLHTARPIDTRRLLPIAIERGVAFMPGEPFYPMLVNYASAIRLNFSYANPGDFERGLKILARLIAQHIPVDSG